MCTITITMLFSSFKFWEVTAEFPSSLMIENWAEGLYVDRSHLELRGSLTEP